VERVWTSVELIRWTEAYLAGKGFDDARLNAELLLAGVLEVKRLDLYLQFERPLAAGELAEFKDRLRRRVRREPLQYIEGIAEFRGLKLAVDRRVLIPRPETEMLVGEVLSWAAARADRLLDVLDVGTGSGAIALALRQEGRFGRVVASDQSEAALAVARGNAEAASMAGQVEFVAGDLFAPLAGQTFDVIVSNPPYIADGERRTLEPEVGEWEPEAALFAGADGLDVIRRLVKEAPVMLRPGGVLVLEIGATQAGAVTRLLDGSSDFARPIVKRDLAGRDRFVMAERLPIAAAV